MGSNRLNSLVEMKGFEPSTPALRTRCSPAELHPHAGGEITTAFRQCQGRDRPAVAAFVASSSRFSFHRSLSRAPQPDAKMPQKIGVTSVSPGLGRTRMSFAHPWHR
jgi:hypothetical protein